MTVNRTIQPQIKTDFKLSLMPHEKHVFSNGCTLFNFPYDTLPACKIDFIFPAGKKHQKAPLISNYTGKMLLEGTHSMTQEQIASEIDFMGASLGTIVNEDHAHIASLTLNRNVPEILNLIHHVLTESLFPNEQLRVLAESDKQDFLVNNERVNVIAHKNLFKAIFSDSHPFGRFAEKSDYDTITSDNLKDFFSSHYDMSKCTIVWTGTMEAGHLQLLETLFGNLQLSNSTVSSDFNVDIPSNQPLRKNFNKDGASQSAIYLGRIFPTLTHKDHFPLTIVSTILGGYFGSRLMKNIREEKGYTYGIGSAIIPYQDLSVFLIASQVKAEYTEETITEIKNEIHRLQNDPLPPEELELVKNYVTGTLMKNLDGPFAQSKFHTLAFQHGVEPEFYLKNISDSIKQIDQKTILQLTNMYLSTDQLFYSVAGKLKKIKK